MFEFQTCYSCGANTFFYNTFAGHRAVQRRFGLTKLFLESDYQLSIINKAIQTTTKVSLHVCILECAAEHLSEFVTNFSSSEAF